MNKITIFGKSSCGYCQRAKQLCELLDLEYQYIDIIEKNISQADLEKTIGKPVLTVPQIFEGKTYVGGFTEFERYVKDAA